MFNIGDRVVVKCPGEPRHVRATVTGVGCFPQDEQTVHFLTDEGVVDWWDAPDPCYVRHLTAAERATEPSPPVADAGETVLEDSMFKVGDRVLVKTFGLEEYRTATVTSVEDLQDRRFTQRVGFRRDDGKTNYWSAPDPYRIRHLYAPTDEDEAPQAPCDVGETLLESVCLPQDDEERKAAPMYRGLLAYFPWALFQVARHSLAGDLKHNPGNPNPPTWAIDKSSDHLDCVVRHAAEIRDGAPDELHQRTALAWRALAQLQEYGQRVLGFAPGGHAK